MASTGRDAPRAGPRHSTVRPVTGEPVGVASPPGCAAPRRPRGTWRRTPARRPSIPVQQSLDLIVLAEDAWLMDARVAAQHGRRPAAVVLRLGEPPQRLVVTLRFWAPPATPGW